MEKTQEHLVAVGRIVLFKQKGVIRPAVITHVWAPYCVNLMVFRDGSDDYKAIQENGPCYPVTSAVHASTVADEFSDQWYFWNE